MINEKQALDCRLLSTMQDAPGQPRTAREWNTAALSGYGHQAVVTSALKRLARRGDIQTDSHGTRRVYWLD